ncbi:MAG: MBL fold metallo-hydrolase [Promethearchaeota archaeon]
MVNIRFLGNACVELIGKQDHIIIDPTFLKEPQPGIERIFLTHHHSDHFDQEKLLEIETNFSMEGKALEIYGPLCVYEEFDINCILIEPTSKIDLINGYVEVFENDCWKAPGCVAYLITMDNKKILHTADSAEFSNQLYNLKGEIDVCFVACFENNFNDYLEFLKTKELKKAFPYHYNFEKEEEAKKLATFLTENGINSEFLSIGSEYKI